MPPGKQFETAYLADMQTSFFPPTMLPGFNYRENFIPPEIETALIEAIDALPLAPFRFQGWTAKRLTESFGWRYDFDKGGFDRTDPIPRWLHSIKAAAADFAGLSDAELVQALLIRYDPGSGIGWHRDRPVFEHVIGISLGAPAKLRFRQRTVDGRFKRESIELAPRSIYHLAGEARHGWEHSIAPMDVARWSITFRSLSAKGMRISEALEH